MKLTCSFGTRSGKDETVEWPASFVVVDIDQKSLVVRMPQVTILPQPNCFPVKQNRHVFVP